MEVLLITLQLHWLLENLHCELLLQSFNIFSIHKLILCVCLGLSCQSNFNEAIVGYMYHKIPKISLSKHIPSSHIFCKLYKSWKIYYVQVYPHTHPIFLTVSQKSLLASLKTIKINWMLKGINLLLVFYGIFLKSKLKTILWS